MAKLILLRHLKSQWNLENRFTGWTDVPLSMEGVENAKEVFIANSAQKLAAKTVEILKNPKIGQRLSNAAYTLVSQKYNWQIISNKLDKLYQEVGAT